MIVQALILLIPIVGWIATAGWLMLAYANARTGRMELPPAGFHLLSGMGIFVVLLTYTVVIDGIPVGLLLAFGRTVPTHVYCTHGACPGSAFAENFYPVSLLALALLNFLVPSLIVNTHRYGLRGGLDVTRIWRLAPAKSANWAVAGVASVFASVIGGLGVCACCVGVLFTIVYQYAIQAGAAAWLETASSVRE